MVKLFLVFFTASLASRQSIKADRIAVLSEQKDLPRAAQLVLNVNSNQRLILVCNISGTFSGLNWATSSGSAEANYTDYHTEIPNLLVISPNTSLNSKYVYCYPNESTLKRSISAQIVIDRDENNTPSRLCVSASSRPTPSDSNTVPWWTVLAAAFGAALLELSVVLALFYFYRRKNHGEATFAATLSIEHKVRVSKNRAGGRSQRSNSIHDYEDIWDEEDLSKGKTDGRQSQREASSSSSVTFAAAVRRAAYADARHFDFATPIHSVEPGLALSPTYVDMSRRGASLGQKVGSTYVNLQSGEEPPPLPKLRVLSRSQTSASSAQSRSEFPDVDL